MKHFLLLSTLLLRSVVFSQDQLGGIPVEGIIPFKKEKVLKINIENKIILDSTSTISTTTNDKVIDIK